VRLLVYRYRDRRRIVDDQPGGICTPLADAALWQTGIFGSSTKQPTAQNIATASIAVSATV
jgi:hypothetical protein